MTIRVIVIDDSASIRTLFSALLSSDPDIDVVATALDAFDAREKIKKFNPDVVTLDVEMPRMNGVSFLEKIMTLRPMPVIMASTLTTWGADITLRALEIGAVDYVTKPNLQDSDDIEHFKDMLIHKVKLAARIKIRLPRSHQDVVRTLPKHKAHSPTLIAMGASTGGVEALRDILQRLPGNMPPIVITQHMPEYFTASFAKRLNGITTLQIHEAHHGQRIEDGNVYISPGSHHLSVVQKSNGLFCQLVDSGLVSGHRPSVDVLFQSVAQIKHYQLIGVILTGMGHDGANGLLAMHKNGAETLGQSEASCVVYGMPKVAYERGAVMRQVALDQMAYEIIQACSHQEDKHVRATP